MPVHHHVDHAVVPEVFGPLEAGRQLSYRRLRDLRDWLRSRPSTPAPKKLGMVAS